MNKDIDKLIKEEGDSLKWSYETNNGILYYCHIKRVSMGYLCGYVSLTESDTFYNIDYDDIPSFVIHGGLTYSGKEGDKWVIGFDCGHYGDLTPFTLDTPFDSIYNKGTYRTMEYVKSECESLCEQISYSNKHLARDIKINKILNE